MELGICFLSGCFNLEAVCRFLENLWTPVFEFMEYEQKDTFFFFSRQVVVFVIVTMYGG